MPLPLRHTGTSMAVLMLLADALSLLTASWSAVLIRYALGGEFALSLYAGLLPMLILFFPLLAMRDLYPGMLLSPPDELKRLSQSITLGFLLLGVGTFLAKHGEVYSRAILLLAWGETLILTPMGRALARRLGQHLDIWGYPTVILGAGQTGCAVAETLKRQWRLGLKPLLFLDDDPQKTGTLLAGLPVAGPLDSAETHAPDPAHCVAILAVPGIGRPRLTHILETRLARFNRVILIPDLRGVTSLWVSATDIGGLLGLDIRHKLLDRRRQLVKRGLELAMIALSLPLSLPLMGLLALAVRLDSPGPIFFRHNRIGQGGTDIVIWKFRSMRADAEQRLAECLQDPELRREWEQTQKLRHDPRITRLGRVLRATSLDELPQLWNVITGNLSLVGPRPIVWDEVERYRDGFELYKRVRPGLTGLWQISGRSNTSYALRVTLDAYYVRNWSVWLDIYILAKTPLELLKAKGAY